MPDNPITLVLDPALIEQLDSVAAARKTTRTEIVTMACREFMRQLGYINSGLPEASAPHAVDVSPAAAALWEASWIDTPIDPAEER
ncbi:MAG: hypothetical protein EXR52_01395 [Dehalococcoidia bacterium]|nr:hypothetical protein [Dehalococcoidia bacterium]